jgi:hypothetical protein
MVVIAESVAPKCGRRKQAESAGMILWRDVCTRISSCRTQSWSGRSSAVSTQQWADGPITEIPSTGADHALYRLAR